MHRSQQDPLITDENAPKHVLLEVSKNENPSSKAQLDPEGRKKEQQTYGVYFDDDYDYLQHLRKVDDTETFYWAESNTSKTTDVKNKQKITLPSSVFASHFEEEEGLLRRVDDRKSLRPDWDPDVIEALDDNFEHNNPENQLEVNM